MNKFFSLFQTANFTFSKNFRSFASESIKPLQYLGFTYYPRHENFKDPPYTPSKLFLVRRIKSMKGLNPKERKVMEYLNLDGERRDNGHVTIVKNIPEVNAKLWKVKHLVIIKPITWSGKLPEDGDFSGTFLKDSGEFLISPKLKITEEIKEATESYHNNVHKMGHAYLKKYLLAKWVNGFSGIV